MTSSSANAAAAAVEEPSAADMPVFKVWDCHRVKKRIVKATTLSDLLSSGVEKLGIDCSSPADCKLVLEEDGSLIDDDEVLIELRSKTFVILSPTEEWTPPMPFQPVQPQSSAFTVSHTQSSDESVPSVSASAAAASSDSRGMAIAVHVVQEPSFDEATEQNIAAAIPTALNIINQFKETSPAVIYLTHELKTAVSEYRRGVIENLLRHEFEAALMGNVPAGIITPLSKMLARNAVAEVHLAVAVRDD